MISISFVNPLYLWYFLAVPFLVISHFYLLRHTKKKAMKFANFEALKRVTGENLITKNLTVLILRVLILSALILSAAGAQFWYSGFDNENDFVLAIDVSASMTAQDIQPDRLEAAKQAAIEFVDNLDSQGKIGLVSFAGVTEIQTLPTYSKRDVQTSINELDIQRSGGTDIAGAIVTGSNLLLDSDKGRTIILLTDGSNTAGTFTSDAIQKAIDYANDRHIIINTIGVGTESGPIGYLPEYYNISSVYDEETLIRIAGNTSGHYYQAKSNEQLQQAYADINARSHEANIKVDLAGGLMLVALLLLFVEWGLINTRFRGVP